MHLTQVFVYSSNNNEIVGFKSTYNAALLRLYLNELKKGDPARTCYIRNRDQNLCFSV